MSDVFNRIHFKFTEEKYLNWIKEKVLNQNGNFDFNNIISIDENLPPKEKELSKLRNWGVSSNAFNSSFFELRDKKGYNLIFTFDTKNFFALNAFNYLYSLFRDTMMTIDYYDKKHFGLRCGTYVYNYHNVESIFYCNNYNAPYYFSTGFEKIKKYNVFQYMEERYGKQFLENNNVIYNTELKLWGIKYE